MSSQRRSLALLGLGLALALAAGCLNANLQRLRSPDLLTLDPHEAAHASHNTALSPVSTDTRNPKPETRNPSNLVQPASYDSLVAPASAWKVHSSLSNFPALFDGDPQTAAVSTSPSQAGQWIFIDLGSLCTFQTVRQIHPDASPTGGTDTLTTGGADIPVCPETAPTPADPSSAREQAATRNPKPQTPNPTSPAHPSEYRIDTADERGFPFALQFVGTGQAGTSTATFHHPVRARFLRITLLEDSERPWSVAEIEIY